MVAPTQAVRMVWQGALVRGLVQHAADDGTVRAAEKLLEDANTRVPFEEGDLMASGRVNQERNALGQFGSEAFVSYDTGYAVRLHEHPEYNFTPPGEGKWLEHAVQRRSGFVEADMAPPLMEVFRLP